jgi:hypothetical protein
MAGFSLTHEERVAIAFIAHNDPRDGFVRRTWLEFKTALCGLLQRTRSNGWISVEERMPERNTLVLVHTDMDGSHVASIDEGDEWFCNYGGEWLFPNVTHWMPLPPGPPEAKR